MTTDDLKLATVADRDPLTLTVLAAFADDPAFNYFFPTEDSWDRNAALFVDALFDARVAQNAIWSTTGLESVAMWSDPNAGQAHSDFSELDDDSRRRLDAYHDATESGLPDERFWYLGILATHPDHRGRRLGRTVMEPGLRQALSVGLPSYLETTNPGNIALYERSGWTSTAERSVDDLSIWVMRHEGLA